MIGPVLIFLIGLIVLIAAGVRFRWARIAAFAWLVLPPAWVWHEFEEAGRERIPGQERTRQNARYAAQAAIDKATEESAYAAFCKQRKREVSHVISIDTRAGVEGRTLLVRVVNPKQYGLPRFHAGIVAQALQSDQLRCQRTGLTFIEEVISEPASLSRRYPACSKSAVEETSSTSAHFELVLGETSQTPVASRHALWNMSVRILDRRTGQSVASDTLYFLDKRSGRAGCPKAEDQLAELIELVFSSAPR